MQTYEMAMVDLADLASDLTTSLVTHLTSELIEGNEGGQRVDPKTFAHECERIVHSILRQHGFVINRGVD